MDKQLQEYRNKHMQINNKIKQHFSSNIYQVSNISNIYKNKYQKQIYYETDSSDSDDESDDSDTNEYYENSDDYESDNQSEYSESEEDTIKSKKSSKIKKIVSKKPRKKPIPATVKRLVWNKYIGENIGKHKCYCCNLTDITQLSFHCGHVISEKNGGNIEVNNLRPICQNCNSSMGIKNMNDFIILLNHKP